MTPWQSTRGWRSRNCTVCWAEEIEWWGTDAKGEPVLHHDGPRCHRLCARVRELEAERASMATVTLRSCGGYAAIDVGATTLLSESVDVMAANCVDRLEAFARWAADPQNHKTPTPSAAPCHS